MLAELTVTAVVPLEVSVTVCVGLDPTATLPKLRLLVLTVSFGACFPLPLRLMSISGCLTALLVIAIMPVAALTVVGVNLTFSVTDFWGFNVIGKVAPEIVNPAPLTAAAEIFTAPVPVDFSVTVFVTLEPTATSPKAKLPELIVNCGEVAATPVAFRLTVAVGFVEELLLTVSAPVAAPVATEANCTCRVTVCFGLRVSGKVAPDTLKLAPLAVAELIVTVPVPVDVSVTGRVEVDPTVTLPKLRLDGLTVRPAVPVAAAASPAPLSEPCAMGLAAVFTAVNAPE